MNKYMQHIRVPTSNTFILLMFIELASDDYMVMNGARSGHVSDKAYTLARLRKEERGIEAGIDVFAEERDDVDSDNQGSNYEVVEEVYDNMNNFDKKLKHLKSAASKSHANHK